MVRTMSATRFDDEKCISLETSREDGTSVKTPVWGATLTGRKKEITL
jgi:hypothetical protein